MKIYAAGSIAGQTQESASKWRDNLKNALEPLGAKVLSPMRATEHLKDVGTLDCFAYDGDPMTSERGITARDRNDVMTCDLVFINLFGVKRYSIGTMIEVGWADAFRKPMVAIMEPGNIHEHAMTNDMIQFRVRHDDFDKGFQEALYITKSVLDLRPLEKNISTMSAQELIAKMNSYVPTKEDSLWT